MGLLNAHDTFYTNTELKSLTTLAHHDFDIYHTIPLILSLIKNTSKNI